MIIMLCGHGKPFVKETVIQLMKRSMSYEVALFTEAVPGSEIIE